MRFLLAFLALFAFAMAHHEPTQAIMDAQLSFVYVVGEAPNGDLYRACSGAIVDDAVYTAGHCVDAKPSELELYVEDILGNLYPAAVSRYEFNGGSRDWAILESEAARLLPSLARAAKPPNVGDTVYVWSAPNGFDLLLFRGMVAGRLYDPDNDTMDTMWYATIDSTTGSSGSVILNEDGEAVAILSIAFRTFHTQISPLSGSVLSELP